MPTFFPEFSGTNSSTERESVLNNLSPIRDRAEDGGGVCQRKGKTRRDNFESTSQPAEFDAAKERTIAHPVLGQLPATILDAVRALTLDKARAVVEGLYAENESAWIHGLRNEYPAMQAVAERVVASAEAEGDRLITRFAAGVDVHADTSSMLGRNRHEPLQK